jgi:Ca2+-binding RTX toxin-like protein
MPVAKRIAVVATMAAAGVLVAAAPAHADTAIVIDVIGTEIFVTAGPGANSFLIIQKVSSVADGWGFSEFLDPEFSSPSPACYFSDPPSTSSMRCVVPGLTMIHVKTGDGVDTVNNFSPAPVDVDLGDGDDWATLGGAPGVVSSINGGPGNDNIMSGASNDAINGGPGLDTVKWDTFTYPGIDPTLPYAGASYPVIASLLLGSARRSPLDIDTLSAVENLTAGATNDTLVGDHLPNVLDGGAGQDYLDGQALNDVLRGGTGNDRLVGGIGEDQLSGGDGDDELHGGDQNDRLSGDAGFDRLFGDFGVDRCVTGEVLNSCEVAF